MNLTAIQAFAVWLNEQTYRDDPIGDLAKEAAKDPAWPPQGGGPLEQGDPVAYFRTQGIPDHVIEKAILEYGAWQRIQFFIKYGTEDEGEVLDEIRAAIENIQEHLEDFDKKHFQSLVTAVTIEVIKHFEEKP